jgi:hypothetical protein
MVAGKVEIRCPIGKPCLQRHVEPWVNSSVRPGGAKDSGFLQASTLDVMGARQDLGKFITELPIAQRGVVLSSGREARSDL